MKQRGIVVLLYATLVGVVLPYGAESRTQAQATLQSVTNGALRAKKRLYEEMKQPGFGKGLAKDIAEQMVCT